MVWSKGQLEVTKILDLGIDRRRVLPPDTLHGQLLFPTFLVAPVIWISRGYREDIAIISPGWCSCHLYRVALLAVSPFELAPVQLLPCCSPFDLAVTCMHSLFPDALCQQYAFTCLGVLFLELNGLSLYERRSNRTWLGGRFRAADAKLSWRHGFYFIQFIFFFFFVSLFWSY